MEHYRSLVAIDAANLHYALKRRGWQIDWEKFKDFCQTEFGICDLYYYEGTPTKSFYFDRHSGAPFQDFRGAKEAKLRFFRFLKAIGYHVRTKPIHRVYDYTEGVPRHKCNFDVELTIDVIDHLSGIDQLVLCSGDGDFVRLIKYCKGRFKKTVVLADGSRLNWELEGAANKTLYIEDSRSALERIRQK
jgi:uncharacterized LabA/DUF88 family protein